jgi:hypothetical protein
LPTGRKRRGRSAQKYESFYVQIGDHHPDYTFSLNNSKYTVGPYWENLDVTINGTFLWPERMKGLGLSLVFLGRREHQPELEHPKEADWKPRNIGVLTIRGKRREFLGSLPYDALWELVQPLPSKLLETIHLYGTYERGRVEVHSVNFAHEVDAENFS